MLFIFGPFFYALLLLISLPFPLIPTSPLHFVTSEPHLHTHHSITHFSLDFHTHLSTAHIPFFSNLHAHPSLQSFPNPSIKITLHYQPIKEAALGNTPIIAFCDTDSPMQCVALLLRDDAAAVIAPGRRRRCHSLRQRRRLRLEGRDPPGAVLAPPRSRSCPPSPENP